MIKEIAQTTVEVVANAKSGAGGSDDLARDLKKIFAENNITARFSLAENGEELVEMARRAAGGDAEIIVAGGGDGTISAVAATLVGSNKTLGVLPMGTLNHFSKDLGIPQELADAARVIAENHTTEVDLAEVNGQIFINNSSLGLYPQIVRKREQQQERLGRGKWLAAFWAGLAIFRRFPFLNVRLKINGKLIERRTPLVFVGNNEYEVHSFSVGARGSLGDGLLSVYVLHRTGRLGLILLAARSVLGILRDAEDFDEYLIDELTIETRRRRILVAYDGEVTVMQSPLRYRILPKALRVIVPKAETRL